MKQLLHESDEVVRRLEGIRIRYVDRMWFGAVVIALIGVPASMLRAVEQGWQPVMSLHLILLIAVMAVYLLLDRLSFRVKASLLLAVFWLTGLAGLAALGMLAAGVWFLAFGVLAAGTLYSMRAGVASAVAAMLVLALAGAGFVSGTLESTVDARSYVVQTTAWLNLIAGFGMIMVVLLVSLGHYHRSMVNLLHQVEVQRKHILRLATHDELTGLPGRRLADTVLDLALDGASRARQCVALLFIDLDGFKTINDHHGHDAGDYVLREVARRLSAATRPADTVARVGGDEFLIVLTHPIDAEKVPAAALRMAAIVSSPIRYHGRDLRVGASIGSSIYPDDGVDPVLLRAQADASMYRHKHRQGSGRSATNELSGTIPRLG